MHRALVLLAAFALSVSAFAADSPKTGSPGHKPRMTWQQHFAHANLAHDGHLTRDEAKSGYPSVAKSFDVIDATHKGYITEDDIRTWHQARRAAHKLNNSPSQPPTPKSSSQTIPPRSVTDARVSIVDASTVFVTGSRN